MVDSISSFATQEKEYMAPFQFLDMGILAYTGTSSALAQVQVAPEDKSRLKISGRLGFGLWRSVYFMKQASFRNRFTVAVDWLKARLFGRDITTID
jgi:NADH dehydrogenase FAD-containing subunit